MSPEFQKKMFEPFTQEYENPRRPRTVSGTGLGLSIVHRVVQEMGGTISVRSAVGLGTTFRVDIIFPDAYCDPKYARQIPAGTAVKEHTALSGRVLLAEDNRINAEIARRLLESYGLSVDWAKDGREAVERFADSAVGGYVLILMDLQMPLMDGYQAAGKIRSMSIDQGKGIIALYDMGSIKTMLETIQEETGIAIRMIFVTASIYYPFFKVYDNQLYAKEQAEKAEEEAAAAAKASK